MPGILSDFHEQFQKPVATEIKELKELVENLQVKVINVKQERDQLLKFKKNWHNSFGGDYQVYIKKLEKIRGYFFEILTVIAKHTKLEITDKEATNQIAEIIKKYKP